MRKKLMTLVPGFLILATALFAQKKTEKYCALNLYVTVGHVAISSVDAGKDISLSIRDTAILNDLKRVKATRYKTTVDVINDMYSKGWTFVTSEYMLTGIWNYYFKREMEE
jgi:hypothetical protein